MLGVLSALKGYIFQSVLHTLSNKLPKLLIIKTSSDKDWSQTITYNSTRFSQGRNVISIFAQ